MKKAVICGLLVLALCFAMVGCQSSQPKETQPLETSAPVETNAPVETAAPSFSNFFDITWIRDTCDCQETIRFRSDGSHSYSCSCGNSVNDADLCEGYQYDEQTKIITLDYEETTEFTINQITVKSCDGKTLVLDFNGEERTFLAAE